MSTNKQPASIKKPSIGDAARHFAKAQQESPKASTSEKAADTLPSSQKTEPPAGKSLSGLIPQGDVRMTANIREELHMKLKMEAVRRRITIGEIIESWIEKNLG